MRKLSRTVVPTFALLTLLGVAFTQAQETGKRVGEKLDQAGRDIRSGLNRAGQDAKDKFASAKTSVQNMGVESRVYGRLHWDKSLNDATIELAVSEQGVVTLNGSVATAKAKIRAVDLTQETMGVTEVIDQLAVRPGTERTVAPVRSSSPRP